MVVEKNSFKREAQRLRVEPPVTAWQRIETKLDGHGASRRLRKARILSAAASVALVISASVAVYYLAAFPSVKVDKDYTYGIRPLVIEHDDQESIYDVRSVKQMSMLLDKR